jgi:hypothetical protein
MVAGTNALARSFHTADGDEFYAMTTDFADFMAGAALPRT